MPWDVKIEGLEPVLRTLRKYPQTLDDVLRPALKAGGTVVVGEQRRAVHKVTRKLAQAVGMTERGQGAGVEVHVGIQPGLGSPRSYSESATARWQKPRAGVNRGNPQDYAKYEEARHPFFLKTFVDKRAEVARVVLARVSRELEQRLRA